MHIDILTLFPKLFEGPFTESILKRAQENKIVEIEIHNIRDATSDKHNSVDDTPCGGGPGMVMRVDVLDQALEKVKKRHKNQKPHILLMTPQGKTYSQSKAIEFTQYNWLIIICGHYEGYDERIRDLIDEEISLGDFVLTGGEIPAMAIVDSVVRLLPGGIGKEISSHEESFSPDLVKKMKIGNSKMFKNLLEYPQYTRPIDYKGKTVPKILLSGDHQKIAAWRLEQSIEKTKSHRPDLIKE